MSFTNYLPYITIATTLFIGILTCAISFLNYRQSRKTWHVNIASIRRKERIDNLIIFYSRIIALAHPDSIKGYAINCDYSFVEKIVEAFCNFNMLLDHRFPKDTELAYASKKLVMPSIDYFNARICYNSDTIDSLDSEYKAFYYSKKDDVDKLCNIFVYIEWTRVKKEVQKGLPIPAEKWADQYEEDEKYYLRWERKYNK